MPKRRASHSAGPTTSRDRFSASRPGPGGIGSLDNLTLPNDDPAFTCWDREVSIDGGITRTLPATAPGPRVPNLDGTLPMPDSLHAAGRWRPQPPQ
jgi:hypothetical protein